MVDTALVCYIRTTASNDVYIVQLYLNWFRHYNQFCVGASFDRTCPVYGAGSVTYGSTFCQWWYSSCYHRMPSRTSLEDRKNISFVVVISYEENNSHIWSRYSIFLLFMHNGIFDGTLTAGTIGGEPLLRVFKPCCECTKAFFQIPTHIACFHILSIGWQNLPH